VILGGLAIRLLVLPATGFIGDIDQFVEWAGHIGRNGLPNAYDAHLSFGPVMAYAWWFLGIINPAIVAAADSSDVGVRIAMKLPALAADFALAGAVWFALRDHVRWAIAGVALVLLHPATWFSTVWWGQYESVYAVAGVIAFVFAIRGRDALAAMFLAAALMTKPQAAPLVVPFAAWYLARAGWQTPEGWDVRGAVLKLARLSAVGLATIVLLWAPFLAANGPLNYVHWLGRYQGEFYALLSISSWNLWWPVQEIVANGKFILDSGPLVGGLSFRVAGYLVTAALLVAVGIGIARRPTPRTFAIGLAAAVLVAYTFLTTMHERYAFLVLPFLAFVLDDRRVRLVVAVFGLTIFANMLAATAHYIGPLVPWHGPVSIAGSVAMVGCALFLVYEVVRDPRGPEPASVINEAARGVGGSARSGTSAGSAAATSGA
jgi:Gpi18-like mannosyltransferase